MLLFDYMYIFLALNSKYKRLKSKKISHLNILTTWFFPSEATIINMFILNTFLLNVEFPSSPAQF